MNYAVVFPGQGAQHPAMLAWLEASRAARPVLGAMARALGCDWRARLADPAWSTRNAVAQVLIVGTSLAAWRHLAQHLPPPSVVAGYSVGELTALACAGVIEDGDAIALAQARAAAMDAAAGAQETGLLAVNAGARIAIEPAIASLDVEVAIDIGPGRCALGGTAQALDAVALRLATIGARCTRLNVNVASHTRFMQAAQAPFSQTLSGYSLQPARMRVVANATGHASADPAVLRQALVDQLASTLRWRDCMATLVERGPDGVIEVGPGRSLAGYWADADAAPIRSLEDFADPDAAIAWLDSLAR